MNSGYNSAMFSGPGDFNQMQMMMAMQNGMTPGSFGNFSMMGTCLLQLDCSVSLCSVCSRVM